MSMLPSVWRFIVCQKRFSSLHNIYFLQSPCQLFIVIVIWTQRNTQIVLQYCQLSLKLNSWLWWGKDSFHLFGHVIEDPRAVIRENLTAVLLLWNEVLGRLSPTTWHPPHHAAVDPLLLHSIFSRDVLQVEDDIIVSLDENLCGRTVLARPGKERKGLENEEVVVLWEVSHLKLSLNFLKLKEQLRKKHFDVLIWTCMIKSLPPPALYFGD